MDATVTPTTGQINIYQCATRLAVFYGCYLGTLFGMTLMSKQEGFLLLFAYMIVSMFFWSHVLPKVASADNSALTEKERSEIMTSRRRERSHQVIMMGVGPAISLGFLVHDTTIILDPVGLGVSIFAVGLSTWSIVSLSRGKKERTG
ncbi:MAG: hypothetical protein AAB421_02485 [Patescibacteria group bacterium]